MYLEIIFSTKTQFKSFYYIPNGMRSLKNGPFCDILGAKIMYKVKQHYSVCTVSTGAQRSEKVARSCGWRVLRQFELSSFNHEIMNSGGDGSMRMR
jgi:hypothetical protein